ncbi:MAG: hypothetical protein K0R55_2275 [Sporomusa sp.]|jgi:hypothetical protein|nr:hypothetical protein [Sporomusa sp.]
MDDQLSVNSGKTPINPKLYGHLTPNNERSYKMIKIMEHT